MVHEHIRRGQHYRTVLIDCETRKPLALLPAVGAVSARVRVALAQSA
ncbi:hypothetical protein [Streptomyces sp. NBC_01594]